MWASNRFVTSRMRAPGGAGDVALWRSLAAED
jgi:hypothetical protein